MKKACLIYFLAMALAVGPWPAFASARDYRYDQGESKVSFALKNLGIVTVRGHFKTFSGSFRFDPGAVENSFVEIRIDTASVDSGLKMSDRNLRSEKFFWSAKHPEIHFVSRGVTEIRGMRFDIPGDLTIRGVTRPVVFETECLSEAVDANAGRPVDFRARTQIRRKDFNLGTGDWLDPVLQVTGETLTISLEIKGLPASS